MILTRRETWLICKAYRQGWEECRAGSRDEYSAQFSDAGAYDWFSDAGAYDWLNDYNVLLVLHKFGPLTDFQLERRTGVHQNSIGKRRGECRDAGFVEMHIMDGVKVKRKSRPGSKSNAQVWRLTWKGKSFIKEWMKKNDAT